MATVADELAELRRHVDLIRDLQRSTQARLRVELLGIERQLELVLGQPVHLLPTLGAHDPKLQPTATLGLARHVDLEFELDFVDTKADLLALACLQRNRELLPERLDHLGEGDVLVHVLGAHP